MSGSLHEILERLFPLQDAPPTPTEADLARLEGMVSVPASWAAVARPPTARPAPEPARLPAPVRQSERAMAPARTPPPARAQTPTPAPAPAPARGSDVDHMESLLAAAVQQKLARDSAPQPAPALDPEKARLLAGYRRRIGDLTRVAQVASEVSNFDWSRIDARAVEIFRQIDGRLTYEQLIAAARLPELHATYMVATLVAAGVAR